MVSVLRSCHLSILYLVVVVVCALPAPPKSINRWWDFTLFQPCISQCRKEHVTVEVKEFWLSRQSNTRLNFVCAANRFGPLSHTMLLMNPASESLFFVRDRILQIKVNCLLIGLIISINTCTCVSSDTTRQMLLPVLAVTSWEVISRILYNKSSRRAYNNESVLHNDSPLHLPSQRERNLCFLHL